MKGTTMSYIDIHPKTFCEDLQQHVAEVIFTKLDGETRTMRCTLMKEYLPASRDPAKVQAFHEQQERTLGGTTITVWDVDARGWRSFRADRVISAQITNVG
jgi:hypothetical protein